MKDIRIAVRISKELKERLERAEQTTGIDEATLVRNCVIALLDEIEREGKITFPLEVASKRKEGGTPRDPTTRKTPKNGPKVPPGPKYVEDN